MKGKFIERFAVVPLEWGPMRDWLNETFPGESSRTRRYRLDPLKDLLDYAVVLKNLPSNPTPQRSPLKADSRKGKPLSLELLIRLHQRPLAGSLRDPCVWLLRLAMGGAPLSASGCWLAMSGRQWSETMASSCATRSTGPRWKRGRPRPLCRRYLLSDRSCWIHHPA